MNPTHHPPTRVLTLALTALVVASPLAAGGLVPDGVPGVTAGPWGAWGVETVWTSYTSEGMDIAVDDEDRPVVAFKARPWPPDLRVGVKTDATSWEFQEVREWGEHPSLVRQDGSWHMAYGYDNPQQLVNQLEYASASSPTGNWSIEVADTRTPAGDIALAVMSDGGPHIIFGNGGADGPLIHVWRTTSGWQSQTIHKAAAAGSFVGVAVDSSDNLHVAYSLDTRGNHLYFDLNYAYYDGSTWTIEEVMDDCGWGADIAVDSQDRPHATCASGGLHYSVRVNGTWETTVVDDGSRELRDARDAVRSETSIELDAEDRPHIAYRYEQNSFSGYDLLTPGRPHYATQLTDGSWWFTVIDYRGHWNGLTPSLALDSADWPHVVYKHQTQFDAWSCGQELNNCNDLRYATPVQSALTPLGE